MRTLDMNDMVIGSGAVLLVVFEEYHRDVFGVVEEMEVTRLSEKASRCSMNELSQPCWLTKA